MGLPRTSFTGHTAPRCNKETLFPLRPSRLCAFALKIRTGRIHHTQNPYAGLSGSKSRSLVPPLRGVTHPQALRAGKVAVNAGYFNEWLSYRAAVAQSATRCVTPRSGVTRKQHGLSSLVTPLRGVTHPQALRARKVAVNAGYFNEWPSYRAAVAQSATRCVTPRSGVTRKNPVSFTGPTAPRCDPSPGALRREGCGECRLFQ